MELPSKFPLLSLPTEIVSHIGLFCIDFRLALPVDALNKSLLAIFRHPQSIAQRALRHFSSPEHALAAEAEKGDAAVLELILQLVKDINQPVIFRNESARSLTFSPTPLARAINAGHVGAVKLLLVNGATITTSKYPTRFEYLLLYTAARSPHVELFRLVAAQLGWMEPYQWDLVVTAAAGNAAVGRDMVLALCNIHPPMGQYTWHTILRAASHSGNLDVVKMLAERCGAAGSSAAKFELHVWVEAARIAASKGHLTIIDTIAEANELPEGRDMFCLRIAATSGPTYHVKLLLEDRSDSYSTIPPSIIARAATRRYAGPLKALLDWWHPPSVWFDQKDLSEALSAACSKGAADSVQLLCDRGAVTEAAMFVEPVTLGHVDVVDVLLTIWEKYDVGAPDADIVLTAVRRDHPVLVNLLLQRHAASLALLPRVLESAGQWGRPDIIRSVIRTLPDTFVPSDPWVQGAATNRAHTSTMALLLDLRKEGVIEFDVKRMVITAAQSGHTGVVRMILRRHLVDASALCQSDEFWSAVQEGFTTNLAIFLLKFALKFCDVSTIKSAAKRLLPIAGKYGRVKVLRRLLLPRGKGAPLVDIYARDNNALLYATEAGVAGTVAFLLKLGVNVDNHVEQAAEVATARGDHAVVNVLNLYRSSK